MNASFKYLILRNILLAFSLLSVDNLMAQIDPPTAPTDTIAPMPSMKEIARNWGPNDTVFVPVIWYRNELMSYKELPMVWISDLPPDKLAKYMEEWNRLRNAVYVTYPYARIAGATINDINAHVTNMSKKERKEYIKSREKELKKNFSEPLSQLSVYQGKILMKLINRQTGNNCYEIIKEYRSGLSARLYQTVAFFFGSSLKQSWDIAANKDDRRIENIVKEIDGVWYTNPYRK